MGRRVIVGTAGHIDHGKTALVLALTGVDTDRWEEVKRRGITIDLGFAPFDLGEGVEASIVDVPGHEGFVRNMLAGATGIDLALLVIAADEGVMPQTEEHLAILELLGVPAGIPVLTKADMVDPEWLELVGSEVAARLGRSRVRWAPPVVTSIVTGQGLDDLRAAVRTAAAGLAGRAEQDLFRLPIDRAFAVAGAGTDFPFLVPGSERLSEPLHGPEIPGGIPFMELLHQLRPDHGGHPGWKEAGRFSLQRGLPHPGHGPQRPNGGVQIGNPARLRYRPERSIVYTQLQPGDSAGSRTPRKIRRPAPGLRKVGRDRHADQCGGCGSPPGGPKISGKVPESHGPGDRIQCLFHDDRQSPTDEIIARTSHAFS